jgi:hypothetical protein
MRNLTIILVLLLATAFFLSADDATIYCDKDSCLTNLGGNWGTWEYLTANFMGGTYCRGIVEFDLSGVFEVGHTYIVDSATMYFYHIYNGPSDHEWGVYHNLESWDEMAVTWANKPDIPDDPDATTNWNGVEVWEEFDVTALVQEYADGTLDNYGVQLRTTTEPTTQTYCYTISSDNGSYPDEGPYLYIEFTDNTNITSTSLGNIKALFE